MTSPVSPARRRRETRSPGATVVPFSGTLVTVAALVVGCSGSERASEGEPGPPSATVAEPCELLAQTYIQAPYDSVWARLTTASAFAAWHTAPGIAFGSAVGDSVSWGTGEGPLYVGVLRDYEPGAGLEHTFSFTFVEPIEESVVRWDVLGQGEVVHVRVRHDCTGAAGTERVITEVGWAKSLARLKTLLETGTAMPWPEDGGSP